MHFTISSSLKKTFFHLTTPTPGSTYAYGVLDQGYKFDLSTEEAVELGRRSIYHACNKDGGSGGVVRVYHVHADGWTRVIAGEDVTKLHYMYAAEKGLQGDEC